MGYKTNHTEITATVEYTHDQPESSLSKILKFLLRVTRWKFKLEKDVVSGDFDQQPVPIPKSLVKNFRIVESELGSRKIWEIQPKENISTQRILFLHGGAYVYNIIQLHWRFIEELLVNTRATVVVPDYPLAPQAKPQDVYYFIRSVYDQLLSENSGKELIIMGDSAGAGLALGFAQQLRYDNKPLPQQLILISPWLDITMTHPGIQNIDEKDYMLGIKGLQLAGKAYAGGLNPKNYMVSPIYGDFHDLPNISLFIGTHDVLISDSRRFREKMNNKKFPCNYFEYPKMFHDWILVTHLRESKHAINQISDLISRGRK